MGCQGVQREQKAAGHTRILERKKKRNLGGVANSQSAPAKASDTTEQHVHTQLMEFISPHAVLRTDIFYKKFNEAEMAQSLQLYFKCTNAVTVRYFQCQNISDIFL